MAIKTGSKTGLKYFGYEDIKAKNPCYDPVKYIPTTWRGTAVDILKMENIEFLDRLWCVLRDDLISERVMRLFAVWSYRQTLEFVPNQDPRSVACADAAEQFALGNITTEQLSEAGTKAEAAVWSGVGRAAREAAWSAVGTARPQAGVGAGMAARLAAVSAAEAAAVAAWSAQEAKLIEMIVAEGLENRKSKDGSK